MGNGEVMTAYAEDECVDGPSKGHRTGFVRSGAARRGRRKAFERSSRTGFFSTEQSQLPQRCVRDRTELNSRLTSAVVLCPSLHDLFAPTLNAELPETPAPHFEGPGNGGKGGEA